MPAVCVTVIGPALPQSAEIGREQYARGRTGGSVQYRSSDVRVSRVQSSCRADSGDRFDADST